MLRVSNIRLGIHDEKSLLQKKLLKKLFLKEGDLISYSIYRESLDARKKGDLHFQYTLDVHVKGEGKILKRGLRDVVQAKKEEYALPAGKATLDKRPVVVGFGPCGMFAALALAELGLRPIVLERGDAVEERTRKVAAFFEKGEAAFSESSNVQFGEGGAGTFSDGKLTTRIKDIRRHKVLLELVEAGAPEEILYMAKPHIGTDKLREIVKAIRKKIERLGGTVLFQSQATDFLFQDERVSGVMVNGSTQIETEEVVLALGHSARDTFALLDEKGVKMERKPFAVGVRIEHPQALLDLAQYGMALEGALHPAEYALTYQSTNGRAVYSFCMCPGGSVVAAASEAGMCAVNGMSEYRRNGRNGNSALVVQVYPEDFPGESPLGGVEFQRMLERKAFFAGGGNYFAPAQRVEDFLACRATTAFGEVVPTYRPGVCKTALDPVFPPEILQSLREAIPAMGRRLLGFDHPDAVLTAVESRTSSPVRIVRNAATCESVRFSGLYPAGEGAGYAGGIVSAAVDGIRIAELIFDKYRNL